MAAHPVEPAWTVAVAVKPRSSAKSRLATLLTVAERGSLAAAMAEDVVTAVLSAATVRRCLVVTADLEAAAAAARLGAEVLLEDAATGLNDAYSRAAAHTGGAPLALLVADLPCLTGADLDRSLRTVPLTSAAVIGDADGTGTVMLAARWARRLRPRFGTGSFARHLEDGARDLTGRWSALVRRDVDTAEALFDLARRETVGRATSAWLCSRSLAEPSGLLVVPA